MKPVMILVVIAAAGLAAYFAVSQKNTQPASPTIQVQANDTTKNVAYNDVTLKDQGVPAQGEPEFDVQVRLEKVGQQHKFHFKVQEKHGWAANGVYLAFWHQSKDPQTGEWVKNSRETQVLCSNSPLRFGKPLEYSTTVAVYEFPELKDFGATENWAAKVTSYSDLTAKPTP